MKSFLLEGFEYDLWANRRWFPVVAQETEPGRLKQVMAHILATQAVWLARTGLEDATHITGDFPAIAIALNRMWIERLNTLSLDDAIQYTNSRGEAYVRTVEQIGRHVINHGTYHRGQLREVAQTKGYTDWPESDLIYFEGLGRHS